MRKPALYGLSAAVLLLIGALAVLFLRYRQTTEDFSMAKAAEQAARDKYASTIDAIAEIQDSLSAISLGDSSVRILSRDLQSEQRIGGPDGQQALDRISELRASILRNKQRIRDLESAMHRRGIQITGLEKMIARLKTTVSEKEAAIAVLTGQVDSLKLQVTDLTASVEQGQATIRDRETTLEERRRELATVYYVVGTRKDLTQRGIVALKGGMLGLGRTLQATGRFDPALFNPLDTDAQTVVRADARKVQVLTPQPPGSYELRSVGTQTELHILDPREFRKVRQLVIVTT
jgi:hypothetical protein